MRTALIVTFILLIATALQGLYPSWLMIRGVQPDLILVVLIWASLRADPLAGALLGFLAGLLHGSIVGVRLGTFIATRTIGGFLAGSVTVRLFGDNPAVPIIAAFFLTLIVETLFLLLSPVTGLLSSLRLILIEAVYNAALVLILTFISEQLELRRKIHLAQARFRP